MWRLLLGPNEWLQWRDRCTGIKLCSECAEGREHGVGIDGIERDLRAATRVLERLGTMFEDVPLEVPCEAPVEDSKAASQTPRRPS